MSPGHHKWKIPASDGPTSGEQVTIEASGDNVRRAFWQTAKKIKGYSDVARSNLIWRVDLRIAKNELSY
jgi:hypothetical protein